MSVCLYVCNCKKYVTYLHNEDIHSFITQTSTEYLVCRKAASQEWKYVKDVMQPYETFSCPISFRNDLQETCNARDPSTSIQLETNGTERIRNET